MSAELARITGLSGDVPAAAPTVENVRDAFARLGRDDPEVGHSMEDTMLRSALEAIRDGHPNPTALARDVLIVADAEFPRWYA